MGKALLFSAGLFSLVVGRLQVVSGSLAGLSSIDFGSHGQLQLDGTAAADQNVHSPILCLFRPTNGPVVPQDALTHFDADGASQMVDVSGKRVSLRIATASAQISMLPETLDLIRDKGHKKGDVLEVARLAGIMATKRTGDLIPLCHPLPVESAEVKFSFPSKTSIKITTQVTVTSKTGVEMEALTAASVAALTIYDMCKAVDRGMVISEVLLEEKQGGRTGHWKRTR